MTEILSRRALNRATLARQMLLAREQTTVLDAMERLAGMQAQEARPPFIGLWSRIEGFQREDLTERLLDRQVVRATAMRGTLHLMSARDYRALRPALQPALTYGMQSVLRNRLEGLDIKRLLEQARAYFDQGQATFEALRAHLTECDPACDVRALAYAVRTHLPLVQVPTETRWGYPSTADFALAESWLDAPFAEEDGPDPLVLRYLAAFGPASAADAQAWSGLKGIASVFNALRPNLLVFKDERGRELFDLPDSPRPSEETPATVRFLPDYDNLLLSHTDRSRIIADEHRGKVVTANLRVLATFLVDGFVAGTWKIERKKAAATLVIEPFDSLPDKAREELAAEGDRLLHFVESDATTFDIRFGR